MYRTGDRVRRRADGNIEFLGRVDRQIKINGKRVELDEIEAVLRRSPQVADAAVTAPPVTEGARRVNAYVKLSQGENSLDTLRTFVKGELPDYMFPATFTVLAELPLSPNGQGRSRQATRATGWSHCAVCSRRTRRPGHRGRRRRHRRPPRGHLVSHSREKIRRI